MQSKKQIVQTILFFLQGAFIGTGAILPGISGGVLCVAFGIYEPMMELFVHPIQSLKKNYRMFIPVILGGLVGFVLLAKLVESLLAASAVLTIALFCGLICGTIPDLMQKSISSNPHKGWGCFMVTLAASFTLFQLLNSSMEGSIQPNFWWYLFCGVIWGLSMVVPGLSSSSILLFIGLYQPMAEGIGNLDFGVLIPLAIGFAAMILASSRLVNWLLNNHYAVMSRMILGFVISSVLLIIPLSYSGILQFVFAVLCFAVGFLLARWMDRLKVKQDEAQP